MLEFELAGIGSRAAAATYDAVLVLALILLVSLAVNFVDLLPMLPAAWAMSLLVLLWFGIIWGYFLLFEAFGGGRTPGKRRVGLRVVMDTGHPITLQAAAVRNLLRLVDIQPAGASVLGLSFVFFQKHNKRIGDLVAATMVVRDQPEEIAPAPSHGLPTLEPDMAPPVLTEAEFDLLGRVVDRIDTLEPTVKRRFVDELTRRFQERLPQRVAAPEQALTELYTAELVKRQSPTVARQQTGGPERSAVAHRFVAQRTEKWESVRARAVKLQRRGLGDAAGTDVVEFAAEYREIAADLARARTYAVDPRVTEYLERVVAAGHHVLYGMRRSKPTRWHDVLLSQLPAAVLQARGYVLAAFLIFAIPGVVGYALIRERPALAEEIMPSGMLARAEAGQRQQAEGLGYAETPSPYLPLMATGIIANNVQVAFAAFAFGVTAGVGTVLVLVFNGLFFGAVVGLFANYGLTGWILTFVAGHGVLELTAIFIAGGAGLLVARAIIAPGDMVRRDALLLRGRLAARLVGAAASLLLLAGVIEGFLSASDAPAVVKLAVSGASVVLLMLFFESGRRRKALFGDGMEHPTNGHEASKQQPHVPTVTA
jgi:uncharacterized membrane protein SpoIIM required for sporulation/uncharacterized RDD family membrane protein YckC